MYNTQGDITWFRFRDSDNTLALTARMTTKLIYYDTRIKLGHDVTILVALEICNADIYGAQAITAIL